LLLRLALLYLLPFHAYPAGFHDYSLVFLRPARPSRAMQRLLKVHAMSHRLRYLQGSATNHTVSSAAAAEWWQQMMQGNLVQRMLEINQSCHVCPGGIWHLTSCTGECGHKQASAASDLEPHSPAC
jgi:hypothetical protein